MTTHTPGPWTVHERASNEIWANRGPIVMTVARAEDDGSEEEANARLIASAPDLLEACRATGACEEEDCQPDHHGFCQTHNLQPVEQCWVKLVRAAIAKATAPETEASDA